MRASPPTRSNLAAGSLRPIQIPELRFPSLSSSSPNSADAGFSSPDSDTLMTPLTGQLLHHSFPRTSIPAAPHSNVKIGNGSAHSISRPAYNHFVPISPPCLPVIPSGKFEQHLGSGFPPNSRDQAMLVDESFETDPSAPHPPPSPFPETPLSCNTPLSPYQRAYLNASLYSQRFPIGHMLNIHFAELYALGDELGAGGYGFVMTAHHRVEGQEVAVKFIVKSKVPANGWMEEESIGRIPTEIMLLSLIDHENIVKCLDVFEDELYFYLVQELHGSPWAKMERKDKRQLSHEAMPALSPSYSDVSLEDAGLMTPPSEVPLGNSQPAIQESRQFFPSCAEEPPKKSTSQIQRPSLPLLPPRPSLTSRRPSHDLFEFIEQSKHKRLTEDQARHIFAQVVEAVHYLDSLGISHRDIKDENLVIDSDLKVKLVDFGSASIADPSKPRPYYELFLGTPAYAASEILLKRPYQAAPAEIWTLGVLLSYLLTGMSPFVTQEDAVRGRISLVEKGGVRPSQAVQDLLRICLDPDPKKRACIGDVKAHRWLRGELDVEH